MKTSMRAIGNLGKDAILNKVNGKSVINFSVASTEKFKDAQGTIKESTLWVDCSYWSEKTGLVPYLKKGSQVFVEGKPDVRSYTTSDGRTGATLVLRITSILLLGSKNDNVAAPPANILSNVVTAEFNEPLDDLPF